MSHRVLKPYFESWKRPFLEAQSRIQPYRTEREGPKQLRSKRRRCGVRPVSGLLSGLSGYSGAFWPITPQPEGTGYLMSHERVTMEMMDRKRLGHYFKTRTHNPTREGSNPSGPTRIRDMSYLSLSVSTARGLATKSYIYDLIVPVSAIFSLSSCLLATVS